MFYQSHFCSCVPIKLVVLSLVDKFDCVQLKLVGVDDRVRYFNDCLGLLDADLLVFRGFRIRKIL